MAAQKLRAHLIFEIGHPQEVPLRAKSFLRLGKFRAMNSRGDQPAIKAAPLHKISFSYPEKP